MTPAERRLLDIVLDEAMRPDLVRASNRHRDRLGWGIDLSRAADDVLRERGLLRESRRKEARRVR